MLYRNTPIVTWSNKVSTDSDAAAQENGQTCYTWRSPLSPDLTGAPPGDSAAPSTPSDSAPAVLIFFCPTLTQMVQAGVPATLRPVKTLAVAVQLYVNLPTKLHEFVMVSLCAC